MAIFFSQFADDKELHAEWASAKMASKIRLAQYLFNITGVVIDPNSLFDIQIKRIHEYKRQLLNILGAVYRYKKLKVRRDLFLTYYFIGPVAGILNCRPLYFVH